ncbi:hypothetical protein [Paracoccus sp. (in: a-proteobacteria)]|uniref:hypothetical protein n=1 Tax=Paracoccus sp. TaxID=267 RepID=UPI003A88F4BE
MKWICAIVFPTLFAPAAWACDPDLPAIDSDGLITAEQRFSEAGSPLQKLSAYKDLLRAQDPDFVGTAIDMGLGSDDTAIRSAALRCRFLMAQSLRVKTLPYAEISEELAGASEATRKLAEEGVTLNFPVRYVDWKGNCASLYHTDRCDPTMSASVRRLSVSYTADRPSNGRFTLTGDNRLIGELNLWNGGSHTPVPAEAWLD